MEAFGRGSRFRSRGRRRWHDLLLKCGPQRRPMRRGSSRSSVRFGRRISGFRSRSRRRVIFTTSWPSTNAVRQLLGGGDPGRDRWKHRAARPRPWSGCASQDVREAGVAWARAWRCSSLVDCCARMERCASGLRDLPRCHGSVRRCSPVLREEWPHGALNRSERPPGFPVKSADTKFGESSRLAAGGSPSWLIEVAC